MQVDTGSPVSIITWPMYSVALAEKDTFTVKGFSQHASDQGPAESSGYLLWKDLGGYFDRTWLLGIQFVQP